MSSSKLKIIKYNNKTYSFTKNFVTVDLIDGEPKDTVDVQLVFSSDQGIVNKKITMCIEKHTSDKKVQGMKYQPRSHNHSKKFGHRAKKTILVEKI